MLDDKLPELTTNGTPDPQGDARFQSLLERACDQTVSAAEVEELSSLLSTNKEVREYYLRYLSLHCSLQNYASTPEQSCVDNGCACDVVEIPSRRAKVTRWVQIFATAAAISAVAAGLYFRWNRGDAPMVAVDSEDHRSESDALPVARVTELSGDILWKSPNESVALHSHVGAGHVLQLARGEMHLTYSTGVELRLLGPAEFVVGPTGGLLLRGGVRAVVPEKGRGFTIETPNGKVIDLGTEFGVAVDDFGVSEVNVFQGMVDMVPEIRGGGARSMRLNKGEAVQWNSDTLVRLKSDASVFGGPSPMFAGPPSSGKKLDELRPVIDERFQSQELNESEWSTLGNVKLHGGSLVLKDNGDSTEVPYLVTKQEYAPNNGPLTIVADIRFTEIGPNASPTFAVLTRSANERDPGATPGRHTMRTCARCSFKSAPDSSSATIEVATKLDPYCALTNNQWQGFDQLQENVPYRLVMRDDGINVTFTVALRDDLTVNKTVTCRSLFRGKQNYVVFEGPASGAVAVDHVQLFQESASKLVAQKGARFGTAGESPERQRVVTEQLKSMAPADGKLVISDNFDGPAIDQSVWAALDDLSLINGRVRLGKPNSREHINTYTARPYLLTREHFSAEKGTLTITGTAEFDANFLDEYGGSFAVMTRADNSRGSGPGWEYSILQRGIRANFWPAAWGQQHSLEIHEKPSATSLSLLVSEGLEINPEAREYFFKVVDDGDRVALTIQDTHDDKVKKTVSVHTSSALKDGFIGFESCWGCPVWLDNVRIYRSAATNTPSDR